jgi:competence protein ComEC
MFVFIHSGLATLVVFGAGLVTQAGIWLVEQIGNWPYAALHIVTPTLLELVLLYGLLICVSVQSTFQNPRSAMRYLFFVCVVLLLTDSIFWTYQRYFHRDLRVTFLDVGQGDAAVVEFPRSQVMVIDGGGFASENFDVGEAILAPFLWSRKIGHVDIVVMSHPQLDHYGGLSFLVKEFSPREFWFNGELSQGERFSQLTAALEKAGVIHRVLCHDAPKRELAGVQIQVLHPPCQFAGLDTNNASLVLRLSHGMVDILFTGDIEVEGEHILLSGNNGNLRSEIVKVPHHGSRTSSSSAFVNAVSPQVAVASLGYGNRFNFPAAEVVQRYTQQGGRVLRTDQLGAITAVSNGQSFTLTSFHVDWPES